MSRKHFLHIFCSCHRSWKFWRGFEKYIIAVTSKAVVVIINRFYVSQYLYILQINPMLFVGKCCWHKTGLCIVPLKRLNISAGISVEHKNIEHWTGKDAEMTTGCTSCWAVSQNTDFETFLSHYFPSHIVSRCLLTRELLHFLFNIESLKKFCGKKNKPCWIVWVQCDSAEELHAFHFISCETGDVDDAWPVNPYLRE